MKVCCTSLILILFTINIFGQINIDAEIIFQNGRKYFDEGDFEKAKVEFKKLNHSKKAIFYLSKMYAIENKSDSSFMSFDSLIKKGWNNINTLESDSSFNKLKKDSARFNALLNKLVERRNFLSPIKKVLDSIAEADQLIRSNYNGFIAKHKANLPIHLNSQDEIWRFVDSSNLIIVEQAIEKYGFLSWDEIGRKANDGWTLVIQHAPLEVQKKYLPLFFENYEKENISLRALVLLYDRVNSFQGKCQWYGTQYRFDKTENCFFLDPLCSQDFEQIDKVRLLAGLTKLEKHLERFNIKIKK